MPTQTNPRTITTSGGMTVVSIPDSFLDQLDVEVGDQVVLRETENGFEAIPVEWREV